MPSLGGSGSYGGDDPTGGYSGGYGNRADNNDFFGGLLNKAGDFFGGLKTGIQELGGGPTPITPAGHELIEELKFNTELWNQEGIPPQEGIPALVIETIMEDPDEYVNQILGMNPYGLPEKFMSMIGSGIGGGAALSLLDPQTLEAAMNAMGLGQLLGGEGIKGLNVTGRITAQNEALDILKALGFESGQAQTMIDEYFGGVNSGYSSESGSEIDFDSDPSPSPSVQLGPSALSPLGPETPATLSPSFTEHEFEGFGSPKTPLGVTAASSNVYSSLLRGDTERKRLRELEGIMVPEDMIVDEFSL